LRVEEQNAMMVKGQVTWAALWRGVPRPLTPIGEQGCPTGSLVDSFGDQERDNGEGLLQQRFDRGGMGLVSMSMCAAHSAGW